jgi:hypothetical protein
VPRVSNQSWVGSNSKSKNGKWKAELLASTRVSAGRSSKQKQDFQLKAIDGIGHRRRVISTGKNRPLQSMTEVIPKNRMSRLKVAGMIFVLALISLAIPSGATADEWNRKTKLTFGAPVGDGAPRVHCAGGQNPRGTRFTCNARASREIGRRCRSSLILTHGPPVFAVQETR